MQGEVLDEVTSLPMERLLDVELSPVQLALLPDIRWNDAAAAMGINVTNRERSDGVPEGVQCERDTW